jgi:hypothetical protein
MVSTSQQHTAQLAGDTLVPSIAADECWKNGGRVGNSVSAHPKVAQSQKKSQQST